MGEGKICQTAIWCAPDKRPLGNAIKGGQSAGSISAVEAAEKVVFRVMQGRICDGIMVDLGVLEDAYRRNGGGCCMESTDE